MFATLFISPFSSPTTSSAVTEPIHGPAQADLLALQFVTDENEKLPASKLSDRKKREFQFVLNAADQKKAL
jgi:hypothetical protein